MDSKVLTSKAFTSASKRWDCGGSDNYLSEEDAEDTYETDNAVAEQSDAARNINNFIENMEKTERKRIVEFRDGLCNIRVERRNILRKKMHSLQLVVKAELENLKENGGEKKKCGKNINVSERPFWRPNDHSMEYYKFQKTSILSQIWLENERGMNGIMNILMGEWVINSREKKGIFKFSSRRKRYCMVVKEKVILVIPSRRMNLPRHHPETKHNTPDTTHIYMYIYTTDYTRIYTHKANTLIESVDENDIMYRSATLLRKVK
ncbi:hypothetical protein WN51_14553 [Melipona quadrifasciata]|uniref:Uncharacterized protein n=1 Tax=Melipona quadrifasciata TaxID=166423 RepID=A0A0M8ZZ57_9HYME|nr:hypothetical protein WN51_14553 [Melipona quadrifasciata]